ncbi:MAG: hypothetical protein A2542_03555 [Parcubacteria group bacterium RIFOXYD2_FULL_52_8]|nr:MAG: hypothetical protein A2542_03555 [Parcubacteria group bacterium RIFOXYD2_FULL_52_8]
MLIMRPRLVFDGNCFVFLLLFFALLPSVVFSRELPRNGKTFPYKTSTPAAWSYNAIKLPRNIKFDEGKLVWGTTPIDPLLVPDPENRLGFLYARRPYSVISENEASFPVRSGFHYYLALVRGPAEVEYRVYEVDDDVVPEITAYADLDIAGSKYRGECLRGETKCVTVVASVNRVADPNFEKGKVNDGIMIVPQSATGQGQGITLILDKVSVEAGEAFTARVFTSDETFEPSQKKPLKIYFSSKNNDPVTIPVETLKRSAKGKGWSSLTQVRLYNQREKEDTYTATLLGGGKTKGNTTNIRVAPGNTCQKVIYSGAPAAKHDIVFVLPFGSEKSRAQQVITKYVDGAFRQVEPYKSSLALFNIWHTTLTQKQQLQLEVDFANNYTPVSRLCGWVPELQVFVDPPGLGKNSAFAKYSGDLRTMYVTDKGNSGLSFIHELGHHFRLGDEYVKVAHVFGTTITRLLGDKAAPNCAYGPGRVPWQGLLSRSRETDPYIAGTQETALYTGKAENCFTADGVVPACRLAFYRTTTKSAKDEDQIKSAIVFEPTTQADCLVYKEETVGVKRSCMYKLAPDIYMCKLDGGYIPCDQLPNRSTMSSSLGGCDGFIDYYSPTINSIMRYVNEVRWPSIERVYGLVNEKLVCGALASLSGSKPSSFCERAMVPRRSSGRATFTPAAAKSGDEVVITLELDSATFGDIEKESAVTLQLTPREGTKGVVYTTSYPLSKFVRKGSHYVASSQPLRLHNLGVESVSYGVTLNSSADDQYAIMGELSVAPTLLHGATITVVPEIVVPGEPASVRVRIPAGAMNDIPGSDGTIGVRFTSKSPGLVYVLGFSRRLFTPMGEYAVAEREALVSNTSDGEVTYESTHLEVDSWADSVTISAKARLTVAPSTLSLAQVAYAPSRLISGNGPDISLALPITAYRELQADDVLTLNMSPQSRGTVYAVSFVKQDFAASGGRMVARRRGPAMQTPSQTPVVYSSKLLRDRGDVAKRYDISGTFTLDPLQIAAGDEGDGITD